MLTRSLVSALLAVTVGLSAHAVRPALAQQPAVLSLNAATASPAGERNTWQLTLAFGRADRSASANARSVHAPQLAAHDIMISTANGLAAPFIIRTVAAPTGNELAVTIEYFGAEPLDTAAQYTVSILDPDRVAAERASAAFDFLPPALPSSDG